MKIISWNINSVRLRMPLVKRLIAEANPDILCLQETKVDNPLFPEHDLKSLGFPYLYFDGQKSYNGVAILSKIPLKNIETTPILEGHKRHIKATLPGDIDLHNFYIPAGGDIPDPKLNQKFDEKLRFVDAMTSWSGKQKSSNKIIILGDFNIAPLEHDVWSHKQLLDVVSHTPIEVEKLTKLKDTLGWIDTHREHVPHDQKLYSWWSYRARDWEASNRGRRLDHIWITPNLRSHLGSTHILQPARGWEQPSDHVPIVMEFNI